MNRTATFRHLAVIAAFVCLSWSLKAEEQSTEPTSPAPADPSVVTTPSTQAPRPRIEVVFALDTTGSMSGLIAAAKEKIWSIATTLATAEPTPEIRMGLVGYRDRGDDYITTRIQMTDDLDAIYSQLMSFQAGGGGDGPESVNQALREAVHNFEWSTDSNTYRVIFLVGDAPPHMDYDEVQYPTTLSEANRRGIFVNTIQCGQWQETTPVWVEIARLGEGHFFQVEQSGGAIVASTPFDEELAQLARDLDATRIFYGTEEELAESRRRDAITAGIYVEGSVSAQARRALFNTSDSGGGNFLGGNELVDDWANNRVDLEELEASALPADIRSMSHDQRIAHLSQMNQRRQEIAARIQELGQQRQEHLAAIAREQAASGEVVLDDAIYGAIREGASHSGIDFAAEAPIY
ncbi:MAG: VWA domain-containing protein [Bradymonadales bacterium]|nr:VWA domain-containing protein [Bradymonadales bacterium]